MPGTTAETSKMKRKRAALLIARQAPADAHTRDRQSTLKGRRSSDISGAGGQDERYRVSDAAEVLTGKSCGSSISEVRTPLLLNEKATKVCDQESCVRQDAGDDGVSAAIDRVGSENGSVSRDDFTRSVSHIAVGPGTTKRKRVDAGESETLQAKAPKLSEEARVWQYVCRRAVFVSPPAPREATRKQNGAIASRGELSRVPGRETDGHLADKGYAGKTTITEVVVKGHRIKVTLTRERRVVQDWIEQQSETRFGLDVEWQPNVHKGKKENRVALLQISSENECLLVQMLFLDAIPTALAQFLRDPKTELAGVGIHNDTMKLQRDHGLVGGGEVELTTLAVAHYKDEGLKRAGLKLLAKRILGFDMNKSKSVTLSNWSKSHLTRNQVVYACMDAWVSRAIYCELKNSPVPAGA